MLLDSQIAYYILLGLLIAEQNSQAFAWEKVLVNVDWSLVAQKDPSHALDS